MMMLSLRKSNVCHKMTIAQLFICLRLSALVSNIGIKMEDKKVEYILIILYLYKNKYTNSGMFILKMKHE